MNRPVKAIRSGALRGLGISTTLAWLATAACATQPGGVIPTGRLPLGTLPLCFEANRAQRDGDFAFLARGRACTFSIAPGEAVLSLTKTDASAVGEHPGRGRVPSTQTSTTRELRFQFAGANSSATVSGVDQLPGKVNYLLGNDPSNWRTGVPLFSRVRVTQLYPGVDLVYYGNESRLEYDFVVAPRADVGQIAIHFAGADRIHVNERGDLVFTLGCQEICQPKPIVYQTIAGVRQPVAGSYVLDDPQTVRFQIGTYDRQLPLVIDPILSYATYFGGTGIDAAWGVDVDASGNIYLAGETMGALPTNAATHFYTNYTAAVRNHGDAFVAKFDNAGTNLIYLAYLGGHGADIAVSIAVDNAGRAFVTGFTDSTDFPVKNAVQPAIHGNKYPGLNVYPIDAFVTELEADGSSLVYSTYLGGEWIDQGVGIAVDANANAYVVGYTESTNFTPKNAVGDLARYGRNGDGFVAKLGPLGTNLLYCFYLGGTNFDGANSIAVNDSGQAFVVGFTQSTNFPASTNLPANQLGGGWDAFLTIVGTNATVSITNLQSRFFGGIGNNAAFRVAHVPGSETDTHVTGFTTTDANFPVTPSLLNPGGAFVSSDSAGNWTAASAGLASIVVNAVKVNPANASQLFAGTDHGVARSADGGATWQQNSTASATDSGEASAILAQTVLSLALEPGNPAVLYAGTSGHGVFKSSNGGNSWTTNSTGLGNLTVSALAVDPNSITTVYAATDAGVFRSVDGGTNWFASSGGLGGNAVRDLAMLPQLPGTIYAATANGVYRTSNNASNWNSFNTGMANLAALVIAVAPGAATVSNVLYAGTAAGLYRSADSATNWVLVNGAGTNLLSGTNVTALAVDAAAVYAGTTNGLFKSVDGGANWSAASTGLTAKNVRALAFDPQSPTKLYAGVRGVSTFGGKDAFLARFHGLDLLSSSVLGGSADEEGWDVAIDVAGRPHLTGWTTSTNFPANNTDGLLRATNSGSVDAFVALLAADGGGLLQSGYLGGTNADFGYNLAVDPDGSTLVVGTTLSPNFPVTPGAFQTAAAATNETFLVKLPAIQPVLELSRPSASLVQLSWPAYWSDLKLESSLNNGWSAVTTPPVRTQGKLSVTLGSTTNNALFFRLHR